ncbi:hypothetical protein [Allorhizocola rhizosphaerae]|uniref:hypothetical protein n=1 Tax=Allorhizocola rhizosphaerae TaxID=1872709 RepID=UPI000E3E1BB2|nr:hypothetical protein [Allorhizocola rhizosphaerae]
MFDWDRFEAELCDALVTEVADLQWRAVALIDPCSDEAGVITAPYLGPSAESESMVDDWAPEALMDALTAEACSGRIEHWDAVLTRYEDALVRICHRAGERLGVPVYLIDYERYEETLRRCLTPAQVEELFPEVVAAEAERVRLAGLAPAEQITYYASRLGRFDGPINSEEAENALRGFGSAAIPALLPLLSRHDRAWYAARLLAEVGVADPLVLEALSTAVAKSERDSPAQLWPCRALARLGRLDLVLALESRLSRQALAVAVAAPFTSFRDSDVHPIPLNYQPLEDFLIRYPEAAPDVAEELAPGRSYCAIAPSEVGEAVRGVGSPHVVVRKHAVIVLGEPDLGREAGERVIPVLRAAAQSDPDSEVRRLADLSVQWWQRR